MINHSPYLGAASISRGVSIHSHSNLHGIDIAPGPRHQGIGIGRIIGKKVGKGVIAQFIANWGERLIPFVGWALLAANLI